MGTTKDGGISMKIISFHLNGKMAHFRKFYSNSSALSYYIPPRSTICGIIAGLLGRGRDIYYEEFSLKNCKIAVTPQKSMKKTIQKLNYLMVKSPNDFNGFQEHHSQTPVELIIPQNLRTGYIDYKIWIVHNDNSVMHELENLFNNKNELFYKSLGSCMSLGTAFNIGWIEAEGIYEGIEVNGLFEANINSSIPLDKVIEINVGDLKDNKINLIKEELPLEFDMNRCITDKGLKDILTNLEGGSIPVIVDNYIKLDSGENIIWIE